MDRLLCCIGLHDNDYDGGFGGDGDGDGGDCGGGDDQARMNRTQDRYRLNVESMSNDCQSEFLGYLWSYFARGAYGIRISFIPYEVVFKHLNMMFI